MATDQLHCNTQRPISVYSPIVTKAQAEEQLHEFLEKKYSEKKCRAFSSNRSRLIDEGIQTDECDSDLKFLYAESQQQLKYTRALYKEKEKYFSTQIEELK
jgi:hypothetical protein